MRTLLASLLIGIIILCPILCGAEAGCCCRLHTGTPDVASEAATGPDPCPEDSDNCICQGAVVATVDTLAQQAAANDLAALDLDRTPPQHLAHLTWDGSPTGLAGWGGSRAVRAFLQNYRC